MFGKEEAQTSGTISEDMEADDVDCCSCFSFLRKPKKEPTVGSSFFGKHLGEDHLTVNSYIDSTKRGLVKRRWENGLKHSKSVPAFLDGNFCRETPVRETYHVIRAEDSDGNKMINEYVRECKIGTGSYGKVVLHRSTKDGKRYAIKAFHKSRLSKLRVAPSETAMTDVLREVSIMKKLDHPNIVNLVEVIDDPDTDNFYMVMEYVEGRWICEGSGPPGGIGEATAGRHFRDIVAGLMYLHRHNIVHGDIKPENLLVDINGRVKIGDFSVSRSFEDNNDELRRSPGTPVFTAPECCLGLTYHGKAADVWALGVTLYCMVLGRYPFIGETLQDTYDRVRTIMVTRWNGFNTPLHMLAHALMPRFYDEELIAQSNGKRKAPHKDKEVASGVKKAFQRLFPASLQTELRNEFAAFAVGLEEFGDISALEERTTMNPIKWWTCHGVASVYICKILPYIFYHKWQILQQLKEIGAPNVSFII